MINEEKYLVFECPHCSNVIFIYEHEICCQIFRHAQFTDEYLVKLHGEEAYSHFTEEMKDGMRVFGPHTPKDECDAHVVAGNVYGCAGPFRLSMEDNAWVIKKCDYI